MDKKFFISVGLSLATVWALQYFWHKPVSQQTGEVSLKTEQGAVTPGQGIKVLAREDLLKPIKSASVFEEKKDDKKTEAVIQLHAYGTDVLVASRGGGISELSFNQYKSKGSASLKTISSELTSKAVPAMALFFDEAAPLDYEVVVDSEDQKGSPSVTLQSVHQGWQVRKKFIFDERSYRLTCVLDLEPLASDVKAIQPRLFIPAPIVEELVGDQPTAFMFNEHKNTVEKKAAGAEVDTVWYWQAQQAFIGIQNKYFVHALVGDTERFVQRAYYGRAGAANVQQLILEGPITDKKKSWELSFYMGPKVYEELVKTDERLGTLFTGGWFGWVTKLLLKFLDFVRQYVHNLGFAIIVLAVLLKLPLTPLAIYSRIKMERYQKHSPIINRIRAKYRTDAQMQMQEVTKYHKEHNLAPSTPVLGCLPLLLQIPIMYSLYDVLNNYIQLHQAPFFAWITDLSAKDPFYVIPVLMGISMIWQQAMAPVNDEKQRIVMFFVSIVMTVVFSGLPVGLVLYWLINNVLTILEDYIRRWFFA